MKKTWFILLTALLVLLAGCRNPIEEVVMGEDPEPPEESLPQEPEDPAELPSIPHGEPEEEKTPEEADEALRAELNRMLCEKLGTKDPMTGEEYRWELGDRVTDENGQEYFFGRWVKIIYDLDSGSEMPSLQAEFFLTPDGEHAYVGNYFPANEGNGYTVVLTEEDLLDPGVWG